MDLECEWRSDPLIQVTQRLKAVNAKLGRQGAVLRFWQLLALGALIWIAVGAFVAAVVHAATVTWNQDAQCSTITGWELVAAPITSANPNPQPTSATLAVSIANSGTPPCGTNMTKTVTLGDGVGPTRFWLRAVAGTVKSVESNGVDASVPLTKPGLQTVVP